MVAKSKLPPELEEKNTKDYHAYSQKIEDGLKWIEKNLDNLPLSKVAISTLSKKTGIHRNTLGDSNGRGAYVVPRINKLKELKKQRAEASKAVLTDDEKINQEESKIEGLENKLELQRKETGRRFLQAENLKNKLKETETALKKLAKQNLVLQEENEELLKRTSTKVTSIAERTKASRR